MMLTIEKISEAPNNNDEQHIGFVYMINIDVNNDDMGNLILFK